MPPVSAPVAAPEAPESAVAALLADWHGDPQLFVREALGAIPEAWQAESLDYLGVSDKLAIRSGHGVGKTTLLAWLILWFVLTRNDAKVGVTAPAAPQINANLWPEIRKWREIMRRKGGVLAWLANQIEVTQDQVTATNHSFAVARTARVDQPEALQGLHASDLLFIIDEASGVPDIIFETASGSLSTPGAKIVMTGNPTRLSGYFYDAFHKSRSLWKLMRVSGYDVSPERVDREFIDDMKARYGEHSAAFRVRVLGEFPESEDTIVIPMHLAEAAIVREVEPNSYSPVWGVDVARFGDDRSAIAKRKGNVQIEPIKWRRGLDTMQVVGWLVDEYRSTDDDMKPISILVDVIGVGAGVVDRGRELGLPVMGINVAESPATNDGRYLRLRDELWWRAREWLMQRDCKMADDQDLVAELTSIGYQFTSSGKIQVESKNDMKRRGLQSPDLADAWCLTFAAGVDREEMPKRYADRYARPARRPGTSWLSR